MANEARTSLTLRIDPGVLRFFREWAKREHRSLNEQITVTLEQASIAELERIERGEGIKHMPAYAGAPRDY